MRGYAALLASVLSHHHPSVKLRRVNLATSAPWMNRVPASIRGRLGTLLLAQQASRLLPMLDTDLVHLVDGSQAHITRWLRRDMPLVVTAHDLIPLLQSRGRFGVPPPGRAARFLIDQSARGLERADMIVAVSLSTSRDLSNECGIAEEKIAVVHSALRREFHSKQRPPECIGRRLSSTPFILSVGNNAFYKNRVGVLRVFASVRPESDVTLVMVGPEPTERMVELVRELDLGADVSFVIDPPMERLLELYRSAALLLFPSIHEGFGWPPLEAMACGCPVVCSNAASLPEVVGDAALMADWNDEAGFARQCVDVLGNDSLMESLRERGLARQAEFTPERMGRELMDVYAEVLEKRRIGRGR